MSGYQGLSLDHTIELYKTSPCIGSLLSIGLYCLAISPIFAFYHLLANLSPRVSIALQSLSCGFYWVGGSGQ